MVPSARLASTQFCALLLVLACASCGKESASSPAAPEATTQDTGGTSGAAQGGDVIVQGQLAVSTVSADIAGPEGLRLGQREVEIKDASGGVVAKAETSADGSYTASIPGSLVIDTSGGLRLADGSGLVLESIIADTADQSVIGTQMALDLTKVTGRALKLGATELAKITAIRGKAVLEGIRDSTGIAVYVPGTSYAARTDGAGNFLMTFVPAGSYDLRFEKDGFDPFTLNGVKVVDGDTTKIPEVALRTSGGTGFFSVTQVGREGFSTARKVDFKISAGNADRFRAGTPDEVQLLDYGPVPSTFSYTFDADGEQQLVLIFATADGFESQISKTILVDSVVPDAAGIRLVDRSNLNASFTRERSVLAYHPTCEDIFSVAIVPHGTAAKETDFTAQCYSNASTSDALFKIPDGVASFSYDIWVKDRVGNISVTPYNGTIVFDADAPVVAEFSLADSTSGSSAASNAQSISVTVTNCVAASIDRIVISETQTTPPALSQFTTACAGAHSYSFANDLEEVKRVFVWGVDAAGNVALSAQSHLIAFDRTPPTAPSFTIAEATPASPGANPPYSNSMSLIASSINCSGIDKVFIADGQSSAPAESAGAWAACASTISTVAALGTGTRTIHLWSKDAAGNISVTSMPDDIIVNTSAPSAPTFDLRDPNTASITLTNSLSPAVAISSCASYSKVFLTTSAVVTPVEAQFVTDCTTSGISTSIGSGDATKTVYLWYRDAAGNVSASSTQASIDLDQTYPSAAGLSLGVSDQTSSSTSYTNSTTVNYSVSSCPGGLKYRIVEGTSAADAFTGTWVDCASPTGSTSVSWGDATKTLSVWVKDTAGNVNPNLVSTNIDLDTNAPSAPSITVADASGDSAAGYTNATGVKVTISNCTDIQAVEFNISGSSLGEGSIAQSCTTAANNFSVSLAGSEGLQYVYMWVKDAAGNVSMSSSYITLDTLAPALSDVSTLVTDYTDASFKLSWSTSPDQTRNIIEYGTSSLSYPSNYTDESVALTTHTSVPVTGLAAGTTYYYRVKAKDLAGNITYGSEKTLTTLKISKLFHETNQAQLGGLYDTNLSVDYTSKRFLTTCDYKSGDGGKEEIIMAAPTVTTSNGSKSGAVYVLFGAASLSASYDIPTQADITFNGDGANEYFGHNVQCLDFNGDGIKDILVSEVGTVSNNGDVFIFYGSASPTTGPINTATTYSVKFAAMGEIWGIAAGNINNDGRDDVVICSPTSGADGCYVFYGEATAAPFTLGKASGQDYRIKKTTEVSTFGISVAIGNVDGDAAPYGDIIITSFFPNGESGLIGGSGALYIKKGGALSGTNDLDSGGSIDYTVFGGDVGQYLALAVAGDINNDGKDDILVRSSGGYSENPVYVVWGRPASGDPGLDWADDPIISIPASSTLKFTGINNNYWNSGSYYISFVDIKDLDGDGYKDVLLSNLTEDYAGNTDVGKVCLFRGRSQTAWETLGGGAAGSIALSAGDFCAVGADPINLVGSSVAIGNVNGAGNKELLFGAMGGNGKTEGGGANGEVGVIQLSFPSNRSPTMLLDLAPYF